MSSMLTQEQIMNVLKHVEDPELHKSIVELNMVRNIQMNGTEVKLEVVLTIQGVSVKKQKFNKILKNHFTQLVHQK